MKVSVTDENYEKVHMFNVAGVDDNNKDNSDETTANETSELNSQTVFKNDVPVHIIYIKSNDINK